MKSLATSTITLNCWNPPMNSQERHLQQWVSARRREKVRRFCLWVAITIVVELAILGPVWYVVGR